jgi:hypothetical protein
MAVTIAISRKKSSNPSATPFFYAVIIAIGSINMNGVADGLLDFFRLMAIVTAIQGSKFISEK